MTLVMYHSERDELALYLGKDTRGEDLYFDDEGEFKFFDTFEEVTASGEWQIIGVLE